MDKRKKRRCFVFAGYLLLPYSTCAGAEMNDGATDRQEKNGQTAWTGTGRFLKRSVVLLLW
jgi:hypothetical protein